MSGKKSGVEKTHDQSVTRFKETLELGCRRFDGVLVMVADGAKRLPLESGRASIVEQDRVERWRVPDRWDAAKYGDVRRAGVIRQRDPRRQRDGGYTLARAGCRREALTALDELRRLAGPQGPSPFLVALVYTGLEDNDHAFVWLGKAIETRAWEMPMVKASPVFDRLRSDPRFPALLARVGLPR